MLKDTRQRFPADTPAKDADTVTDRRSRLPLSPTERRWLLGLGVAIVSVWGVSGIAIYYLNDSWGNRGTFGDMFGAVNALFSGLAFAGILVAIYLRGRKLQSQRLEFRQ